MEPEALGGDTGAYLESRRPSTTCSCASAIRLRVEQAQARMWELALHLEEGASERTARALEEARQAARETHRKRPPRNRPTPIAPSWIASSRRSRTRSSGTWRRWRSRRAARCRRYRSTPRPSISTAAHWSRWPSRRARRRARAGWMRRSSVWRSSSNCSTSFATRARCTARWTARTPPGDSAAASRWARCRT